MSIYIEASRFLLPPPPFQSSASPLSAPTQSPSTSAEEVENGSGGGLSLASRIFSQKGTLKNSPGHVYKVVIETRKWDVILARVIESAELLEKEKKLNPEISLLLTHDLLISQNGIAAPKSHALVVAITRHKARLASEFTRARVKAGFATVEAWKNSVLSHKGDAVDMPRPRWARVNTLKVSKDGIFSDPFFSGTIQVDDLNDLSGHKNAFVLDKTIPNLLAFPSSVDLTKSQLYKLGHLILQDKASCIPAYLLNHTESDGDIIDACAAPGNKTSHLASLMKSNNVNSKLYACERDALRSKTLRKMLDTAGAQDVTILPSTDFLTLKPDDARFSNVTSILLDPSCSGSGMLGRDEDVHVTLPRRKSEVSSNNDSSNRKKKAMNGSKRPQKESSSSTAGSTGTASLANTRPNQDKDPELKTRLRNLSNLQTRLVEHALSFPASRKVAYSTCSIHAEENECVFLRVLQSDIAKSRGWRVLRRDEQVSGMQSWMHRGLESSLLGGDSKLEKSYSDEVRNACIRCHKGDAEGTMGFFAVCFVRDGDGADEKNGDTVEDAEEWEGFPSDDE